MGIENPNFSEKAKKDYYYVQAAMNGDEQAFAELLNRYKDSIYFMLLKIVNNKDDAEDLTIEAFGKAFKNLHQYSPKYAFSTWLFKIASNNCIDFLRKQRTQTISYDNDENEFGVDNNISFKSANLDPEENMIKSQKNVIMRNIVKKLKPRYRKLIELRYFEEYSYEEISKELDLPLGTVKAQLFRAKELLYNILKRSNEKI
jgi:RNA polymerase sigma-70 factor (ECF subfamily)